MYRHASAAYSFRAISFEGDETCWGYTCYSMFSNTRMSMRLLRSDWLMVSVRYLLKDVLDVDEYIRLEYILPKSLDRVRCSGKSTRI